MIKSQFSYRLLRDFTRSLHLLLIDYMVKDWKEEHAKLKIDKEEFGAMTSRNSQILLLQKLNGKQKTETFENKWVPI